MVVLHGIVGSFCHEPISGLGTTLLMIDCLASGLWVHFVTSPDIALVPVIKGNHYQVNY